MPVRVTIPDRFLVRARGGPTGWQPFAPVPADIEVDIPTLLLEAPELLNSERERHRYVATMPSNAERVLIAIEENGHLAIAACPDPGSQDDYQRLVADVLWTSVMLWRRPYLDLAAEFRRRIGTELELLVGDRAAPGWSAEQFQNGIRTSLSQGRFPVIFVTCGQHAVPPDMIAYLDSLNVPPRTVSFTTFRSGEVELVMPGQVESGWAEPAAAPRETWFEPTRPEPEPVPTKTIATASEETEPEDQAEPVPPDFPWARAGTKPGVMADKRPPPDSTRRKPDSGTGGRK